MSKTAACDVAVVVVAGLQRINKTNQFNLRTRRYTEAEVLAVMHDPAVIGLQLRLLDRFGDNSIIAVLIGRLRPPGEDLDIDTWLLSCRVLGRQVESSTLRLIVDHARRMGAKRLIGEYLPTPKNAMVKDHYERHGFSILSRDASGRSLAALELAAFTPVATCISLEEDRA